MILTYVNQSDKSHKMYYVKLLPESKRGILGYINSPLWVIKNIIIRDHTHH